MKITRQPATYPSSRQNHQRLRGAPLGRLLHLVSSLIMGKSVENWVLSRRLQITIDAFICVTSFVVAHLLRFDGWPPGMDKDRLLLLIPYLLVARVGVNYLMGLYRRVWRYISIQDGIHLAGSVGIVSMVMLAIRLVFANQIRILTVPISIVFMDFLLTVAGMLVARLSWRITVENASRVQRSAEGRPLRTLLVGAGDAGVMALREIVRRTDLGLKVIGFLDDNPNKLGTVIQGVPVLGPTANLEQVITTQRVDQIIITIANARRRTIRRIIDLCNRTGLPVKIIPALFEILGNQVTVSNVRGVEIEDLLGRESIDIDHWLEGNRAVYRGKRILVTGAGGSIGRELCRQLLILEPESIIILDKDENAVFEAERDLQLQLLAGRTRGLTVNIVPLIGDLRFEGQLRRSFERHTPQIVFHAAAHKHVPLMEVNSAEAVLNNVIGTVKLLDVVAITGVERCVMVSTDKAVNPTNIMGATKRVAELMFQARALEAERAGLATSYSCVRFGNVLGSRGSVIPIFREQIRQGGPLTVTDPDVERYFMTIPEAAQLIIQAGAMGRRGEIFLLDMGEPVRLVDLARDMIQLSGLTPGEDIEIKFTGLRPGEKLREELLIAEEGAQTTSFEKIFIAPPLQYDFQYLNQAVAQLDQAATDGRDDQIYAIFSTMGIGFNPGNPPQEQASQLLIMNRSV
ncbi:MAG: polysaccharide biosynthesis protein [Acidobacteria bacterium]|nr:polysaccharide biosynthesis protein [Acidobacteriota bacterium]